MPVNRVCFYALYDSYLKVLNPVADFFKAQGIQVEYYISELISERMLEVNQSAQTYIKLKSEEACEKLNGNFDVIFLGAGGRDLVKLAQKIKLPNALKVAVFPGISGARLYQGIEDRLGVDVILTNNIFEHQKVESYLADFKISDVKAFILGFTFARKIEKTANSDIVLFDQNFPTIKYSEKIYILHRLVELAKKNPDGRVVIKMRNKLSEDTPHLSKYNYVNLLKDFGSDIPANLVLSYDSVENSLKTCRLAITICSTAIIEAIHNGIDSVILSDFGLRTDFSNDIFLGSNLYANFDQIINGDIPQCNADWVQKFVAAADNNLPALLGFLNSELAQGGRPEKAAVRTKRDTIKFLKSNGIKYNSCELWKEVMCKKYKKFKKAPRIFFSDSKNPVMKMVSKLF